MAVLWRVGAGVALDVALRVVRPAAGPVGPDNPLLSERLRASLAVALAAGLTIGIAVMLNNIASPARGVGYALKAGSEEGLRGGVLTAVLFGSLPSRSGPVTLEFRLHGWFQYDFGDGPRVGGVGTQLFCAWLAWCRFRVVLALLDKTAPSVMAAIDAALRAFGGVPTYALTDNEKTVTSEHVAGYRCAMRRCWILHAITG